MLRVLRLYLKVAIFQPELREHAPHTTSVLKSCDFPVGAAGVRSAYYVAIFKPELRRCAPRTTFVLKSCDFQAGAAADQGGIEPATAGLQKQARKPRDNFQRPFREQENWPKRERFDTHNLRRGFAETKINSHGATARALRRARSPQREFLNLDHANLRRGSRAQPRESPQRVARTAEIVKSPQFLILDHANFRRGSRAYRRNRNFLTSTTRISAEGRNPERRSLPPRRLRNLN